jgi:hypothetical protein
MPYIYQPPRQPAQRANNTGMAPVCPVLSAVSDCLGLCLVSAGLSILLSCCFSSAGAVCQACKDPDTPEIDGPPGYKGANQKK